MENRYLEKVALTLSSIGKALDNTIGGTARNIQRSFKSTKISPFSYRNALRSTMKEQGISRKDLITKVRENTGRVKDMVTQTHSSSEPIPGNPRRYDFVKQKITGYRPKGDTYRDVNNRYLEKLKTTETAHKMRVNRVHEARAKVALGGAGLAGVGYVGYNKGRKSNDVDLSQYY